MNYLFKQTYEVLQNLIDYIETHVFNKIGAAGGLATLNEDGKVPNSQIGIEPMTQAEASEGVVEDGRLISPKVLATTIAEKVSPVAGEVEALDERTDNINERLETVEQLAEISIGGGDIGIATAEDFDNPSAAQRAKVPTVGAILDCMDEVPTPNSVKPVQSGGVFKKLAELGQFTFERGGINSSGANISSGYRARSTYFKVPVGSIINLSDMVGGFPCTISVHEYNNYGDTENVKGGSPWSKSYKTTTAEWVRVTFKFDDTTTHPITDADLQPIASAVSVTDAIAVEVGELREAVDEIVTKELYFGSDKFVSGCAWINFSDGAENTTDFNLNASRLTIVLPAGATTVRATLGFTGATTAAIAFYDSYNVSPESYLSGVQSRTAASYEYSTAVPDGAKIAVVSNRAATLSTPSCTVEGEFLEDSEIVAELCKNVADLSDEVRKINGQAFAISKEYWERGTYNSSGEKASSGYRLRTKERLGINSGDSISIKVGSNEKGPQGITVGKYVYNGDTYTYTWNAYREDSLVTFDEDCEIVLMCRYYNDVETSILIDELACDVSYISRDNIVFNAVKDEMPSGTPYYGKKLLLNELMKSVNYLNVTELDSVQWVDAETPNSVLSNWLVDLQSSCIFGNYIFNWLDHGNCMVMDFETGEIVGKFDNATPSAWHNNNAQFSNIYYEPNDEFPLCLVSDAHLRSSGAECAYVRIQRNGNDFTFTVVQNIIVECEYGVNYGTFVADWMTNKLYMYCYEYDLFEREGGLLIHHEFNPTIIVEYELPAFASGSIVTLDDSKILNMAKYPTYRPYAQGGFAVNGKVFIAWRSAKNAQSYTNEEANAAMGYDYEDAGKMIAVFAQGSLDLETFIPVPRNREMEGLCYYGGKIYLTERSGGWSNSQHTTPSSAQIYTLFSYEF